MVVTCWKRTQLAICFAYLVSNITQAAPVILLCSSQTPTVPFGAPEETRCLLGFGWVLVGWVQETLETRCDPWHPLTLSNRFEGKKIQPYPSRDILHLSARFSSTEQLRADEQIKHQKLNFETLNKFGTYCKKVSFGSNFGSCSFQNLVLWFFGSLKYPTPTPAILLGSFPARSASLVCPVGCAPPSNWWGWLGMNQGLIRPY